MLISYLLSLLSVLIFCACSYALIKATTTGVPVVNESGYSKAALRVARRYKIFAWAVMSLFFLAVLVDSFLQVFVDL